MLNLLCLQAELTTLRAEFLDLALEPITSDSYPERNAFENKNPIHSSSFIK